MALVLADRIRETTTTTGTGTITLAGAVTGYRSFATVGNGNTTYYTIAGQNTSEWEVGIGTYTSAGTTLARTTVLASSNAGSAVTFSAGTKDVFVTYPAGKSIYQDANGGVTIATPASGTALDVTSVAGSGPAARFRSTSGAGNDANISLFATGTREYVIGAHNTGGNFFIQDASSSVERLTISSVGNVTINAPTSGTALSVTGVATGVTATFGGSNQVYVANNTPFITGGNIASDTSLAIGTSGASAFYVYTNTVQRAYITSAGNVTINAPTSGLALTVTGVTGAAPLLLAGVAGASYLQVNRSGAAVVYIGSGDSVVSGGPSSYAGISGGASGGIVFGVNGSTEAARLDASGNLGIGVTPTDKLDVYLSSAARIGFRDYSGAATITAVNGAYSAYAPMQINGSDIRFSTAYTERMRLDSVGNLGIGVTPSAWSGVYVTEYPGGIFYGSNTGGTGYYTGQNTYYNGTNWIYKTTAGAAYQQIVSGTYTWFTAPSGTAATAVTFRQTLAIANTGNVTIAAPASGVSLVVTGATSDAAIRADVSPTYGVSLATYDGTATGVYGYYVGNTNFFGSTSAHAVGLITANIARMTVSSSGNVTINAPTSGVGLTVNGLSTGVDTLRLSASANAAQGQISFYVPAGLVGSLLWDNGTTLTGTANSVALGGAAGALALQTGSSNRVLISGSGNVTINTPASGTTLVVNNNVAANNVIASFLNTSNGTSTSINSPTAAGSYLFSSAAGDSVIRAESGAMNIGAVGGATNIATASRQIAQFTTTGVTINAPSSGVPLTISGLGATNTNIINFNGNTTGSQYIQWNSSGNTTNLGIDNSSGGYLVTGSSAYATVLANNLARDLILGTNNAVRILVGSSGNVTINAPASGTALTVNGQSKIDSSGIDEALQLRATANTYVSFYQSGTLSAYIQANGTDFRLVQSSAGTMNFNTGGNNRLSIANNGNVTINAPASGASLAIAGVTGSTALTITNGTSGTTSEYYQSWSNGTDSNLFVRLNQVGASSKFAQFETTTATPIYFGTNSSARLLIGSAGNVTINAPTSGTSLYLNQMATGAGLIISDGTRAFQFDVYSGGSELGTTTNHNFNVFTNSVTRMTVSNTGNVTINAPTSGPAINVAGTAQAWAANNYIIQLGNYTSIRGDATNTSIQNNSYWDGISWKYTNTNPASMYYTAGGSHYFYYAGSGTAGTTVGWGTSISINSTGNVSINGTASGTALTLYTNTGGVPSLRMDSVALTGSQTATFSATNKPGTGTSSPSKWLAINLDGSVYYIPCWL